MYYCDGSCTRIRQAGPASGLRTRRIAFPA
jgi:hypothetical protein